MKAMSALLLLVTVACCAGPVPDKVEEPAVLQPPVACRAGADGAPVVVDRGIGGTGAPARSRIVDRGIGGTGIGGTRIGGTGIVGVVTGFASVCVNGLEVRLDATVPVLVDGMAAMARQLRVGQVVVIEAAGHEAASRTAEDARTIAVRHEVLGPVESVDTETGAMMVAGQRVVVLPTTWVAGRFGQGAWVGVSGLRQPDGSIAASRLDRARPGTLTVRGQISRDGETTRIGSLILRGAAAGIIRTGAFVSITGRYVDRAAEVTAIDADPLSEDPVRYFGASARQVIVQGFVSLRHGTVWLGNGQSFPAGPDVRGAGSVWRNAIVRLERTEAVGFIATELHATAYRAQPADPPAVVRPRKADDLMPPPEAPPGPRGPVPAGKGDGNGGTEEAPAPGPDPSPGNTLISRLPSAFRLSMTARAARLPPGAVAIGK
jgi:hypothetical protein